MPTLQERIEAATKQVETDSAKLKAIVHGDADTVVQTDGGPVNSAAKVLGDLKSKYKSVEHYAAVAQKAAEKANTDAAIDLNAAVIAADFDIPDGHNALSVGPVTVVVGKTVTIAPGSVWAIN